MSSEYAVSVATRTFVGIVLASLLGFVGMVATGLILPPSSTNETLFLVLRVAFIGAGCALGAIAAWFNVGEGRFAIAVVIALALLGGLAGAGAGFLHAEELQDAIDPFRRVQQIARTSVFGAVSGANALPLLFAIILWRRGEL